MPIHSGDRSGFIKGDGGNTWSIKRYTFFKNTRYTETLKKLRFSYCQLPDMTKKLHKLLTVVLNM